MLRCLANRRHEGRLPAHVSDHATKVISLELLLLLFSIFDALEPLFHARTILRLDFDLNEGSKYRDNVQGAMTIRDDITAS